MRDRSGKAAACVLVLLLVWLPARSGLAAEPLTLAQAQTEARAHAPDVDLLAARLTAADALATDARRAVRRDPTLNFNAAPGEFGGDNSERDIGVGLRWSLDVTGSWVPRRISAGADRDRTRHERDDGLRALDEAVAIAHADAEFLQRPVERAESLLDLHDIAADAARRQLDAGTGNQIDLDAAELDQIQTGALVEQLRGDLRRAQVRLARLLGRPPQPGVLVAETDALRGLPPQISADAVAARDPRIHARQAEHYAAQKERDTFRRLIWGGPTLGIDYNYRRRSILAGAFHGPGGSGLSASWTDQEITLSVTAPIPVADRQTAGRARARGRIAVAEAQLAVTRADVSADVAASQEELRAALAVMQRLAPSREILARELNLVELALKAGTMDAVTRAATLRRLLDVGRRLDEAHRACRIALAHWVRQTV